MILPLVGDIETLRDLVQRLQMRMPGVKRRLRGTRD